MHNRITKKVSKFPGQKQKQQENNKQIIAKTNNTHKKSDRLEW